jgi:hypothetical protein
MANMKEKAKKAIAEITRLLFGSEKVLDTALEDGTPIKILGESIAEGVQVTGGEGKPIPGGEYRFRDGTIITCAEGKITSLKTPEKNKETDEKMRTAVHRFTAEVCYPKFQALEKEINDLKIANRKTTEAFAALMGIVQELADAPAAEPAEPVKSSFKRSVPEPAQRIKEIASVIENFKKNKN